MNKHKNQDVKIKFVIQITSYCTTGVVNPPFLADQREVPGPVSRSPFRWDMAGVLVEEEKGSRRDVWCRRLQLPVGASAHVPQHVGDYKIELVVPRLAGPL